MRIGHGYDAHRFCDNKSLVVGGIIIPHNKGLLAHSDGDVLIHAICDSLLGAAGKKDIGNLFPDNSPIYKDIDSCILLAEVKTILDNEAFEIEYIDCTILAQVPKFSQYIDSMRTKLSNVLSISKDRINIKATTEEHMGFTGREEGIASHAVCILNENKR